MPKRKIPVRLAAPQENILRAAAEEFAERGFEGARVDEIARRAGVNKAMLYYHVGDKAALYEKVLVEGISEAASRVQEGIAGQDTSEGKLMAVARAFEGMALEKPHMPRIMLRELAMGGRDLPTPVLKALVEIILMEESILESAVETKQFRAANPLSVHVLLVGGIMLHMAARSLKSRIDEEAIPAFPEPPDHTAQTIGELLLYGLLERAGSRGMSRTGASPSTDMAKRPRGRSPRQIPSQALSKEDRK